MDSGKVAYVRDGKTYSGGWFGGDLEEAVKGNPTAEEYAREYKSGMITGFAATVLGIVGIAGGLTLTGFQSQQPNGQAPIAGLLVLGGGLVFYGVGLGVALNAMPHLYDAINAYNDGVDAPSR
jgi:hypothetical protein